MIWYVALGSAVGGVARYSLGMAVQTRLGVGFPVGTLVVNITASVLLGFLLQYTVASAAVTPQIRVLLTTGFCGGYSTFSSFTAETVTLAESGFVGRAAVYVVSSIVLGLGGIIAGGALAAWVLARAR
jgi:fluoride exporter